MPDSTQRRILNKALSLHFYFREIIVFLQITFAPIEKYTHKPEEPTHKIEKPTHKMKGAELKPPENLKQYFTKGKDSVEIVLAGKFGTGKSALVNSIVGKRMAKEGYKAFSETTKIVCYTKAVDIPSGILKKPISVVVWDTPGLVDPFGDDEATVKEIAEKYKEADLLVYCLDIRGRFAHDDATGIKLLTEALGQQMWNHAIFVLTFANEVEAKYDRDAATELRDKITSWTDAIKRLMMNLKPITLASFQLGIAASSPLALMTG